MEFAAYWNGCFKDLPPLGHVLRVALPARWVRFHALPDAKRYAQTDAERAEILVRGRAIGGAVLGDGARWCVRSTAAWGDGKVEPPDWRDTDVVWRFAAERVEEIDEALLWGIAEDRTRAVYVSAARPVVFAPYDGGFDVIMESAAQAGALRARFSGWLSARPDGL